MPKMPKDIYMNNDEKTLKLPRVVHFTLKRLSTASGLPMYSVLANLLLRELTSPSLLCVRVGRDYIEKVDGVAATQVKSSK
jgi:hypothetical protein